MNKPKLIDLGFGVARLTQGAGHVCLTIMMPECVDEHYPRQPAASIELYQYTGKDQKEPLKELAMGILEFLETSEKN